MGGIAIFISVLLVAALGSVAAQTGTSALDNATTGDAGSALSTEPSTRPETIPGRLVRDALPEYPKEFRKRKLQGAVTLRLTIAKDGSVIRLDPVKGDPRLEAVAEDSIKHRKYEPFTVNGQPTESEIRAVIYFALPPAGPTVFAIDDTEDDVEAVDEFKPGHGVIAPRVIHAPDPPYSEKARKDRYQGTCVLSVVVGLDGRPHHIRPVQIVGDGLDQLAIETVKTWEFQPATKNGLPVATAVKVEVVFHLLR